MDCQTLLNILDGHRLLSAFGGPLTKPLTGASPDSRQIRPGNLFCAMKGARLDGHLFIPEALAKGAVAVLVEHPVSLPPDVAWIQVRRAYEAFGLVAEAVAGRPADSLRLIAVTGTNGKTTTAYLLRAILSAAGHATGMVGTVEYDLGAKAAAGQEKGHAIVLPADRTTPTPFLLQELFARMVENRVEYAVLEASSHALAQRRLGTAACAGAVFTNLTEDHLDYHRTMDEYYEAKKLLCTRHLAKAAPMAINCDDSYGRRLTRELSSDIRTFGFSFHGDSCANVQASLNSQSATGSAFTLYFPDGQRWEVSTPLPGGYNAQNAAGAAVLAWALNIPSADACRAVRECPGAPGRLQSIPIPGQRFAAFVDYAHTDDALTNVLTTLRNLPHHRLLVVFGCGGDRDRAKRPKMGRAAAQLADRLYVTSDNPRTERPEAIIDEILPGIPAGTDYVAIPDRREAIRQAMHEATAGDILLVAGKGHEDYQEINGVKHHFNDAEEIAAAVALLPAY
ncbi:MAG: UDP-N-acetylmuramoyl-L-alanyl-D-glutamate--2,6-diaminopimelate ligase [Victivallales bacterium]|nr:UDP-N-acetylmuramoyl-L-alanyl-D-glutamate--2,6-diaminopimelate ligase [Victivallales bacterium]